MDAERTCHYCTGPQCNPKKYNRYPCHCGSQLTQCADCDKWFHTEIIYKDRVCVRDRCPNCTPETNVPEVGLDRPGVRKFPDRDTDPHDYHGRFEQALEVVRGFMRCRGHEPFDSSHDALFDHLIALALEAVFRFCPDHESGAKFSTFCHSHVERGYAHFFRKAGGSRRKEAKGREELKEQATPRLRGIVFDPEPDLDDPEPKKPLDVEALMKAVGVKAGDAEVFELRHRLTSDGECLSQKEIADRTGVKQQSVSKALERTRAKLRGSHAVRKLRDHGGEAGDGPGLPDGA